MKTYLRLLFEFLLSLNTGMRPNIEWIRNELEGNS